MTLKTFLFLMTIPFLSVAQPDTTVNRKKLIIATTSVGVAYTTSMIVLGNAWYKDAPRESFHFFDDSHEWKQMDKVGHFFSAFHVSDNASLVLQSCNLQRKKSDIIGAITGFAILSSIEIFDGYSAAYGASATDLAANAAGSLFYLGQGFLWKDVRIHPKFSFHQTSLARQRPDVLGNGISEILKDYNGQTLWLSVDVAKFIPSSGWPKWLEISGGYGAQDMIYARDNQNRDAGYNPYRQYYLSLDVNLQAIPTRSKFLKTLFKVVNMIKVPAPALEFSNKGIKVHALYF